MLMQSSKTIKNAAFSYIGIAGQGNNDASVIHSIPPSWPSHGISSRAAALYIYYEGR